MAFEAQQPPSSGLQHNIMMTPATAAAAGHAGGVQPEAPTYVTTPGVSLKTPATAFVAGTTAACDSDHTPATAHTVAEPALPPSLTTPAPPTPAPAPPAPTRLPAAVTAELPAAAAAESVQPSSVDFFKAQIEVDVFEAQSTLLSMCAAERLLTREQLAKLRRCLQGLQGAAVQLSSSAGTGQQQQLEQQQLKLELLKFEASFKV